MRATLLRITAVLRLTRVSTALAAIANVWFVILWSRAVEPARAPEELVATPLWALLPAGAVLATALYAFGTCLNDLLDAHRDRVFQRDRPISTGELGQETAVVVIALSVSAATLAATVFGTETVVVTSVLALLIVLFNAGGKHVPAIGMVTLAVIYAGHMLAVNVRLVFLWPVVLVMSHAMVSSAAAHVLARKRPVFSVRAAVFAVFGWAAAAAALVWLGRERSGGGGESGTIWPASIDVLVAVGPSVLAVMFVVFVSRRVRAVGGGERGAEKVTRYGSIWVALYGVAWLAGARAWTEALVLGGLAVFLVVGTMVFREVVAAIEHPIGYRR